MSDFDLVVTGCVVRPDRILEDGYVAVRDGVVERVGQGAAPAARERHNFGTALVLPGAIDSQVHSRSQRGQEDFIWSTRSAAAGGVSTIVDMPYDDGFLVCTGERLRQKAKEAGEQARVDFALYGTVHPDHGGRHIADMAAAGAAGFKFSTFGTHPDRFPRIPPQTLYTCFAEVARSGLIAGVHNENDEFVRATEKVVTASGITDYRAHGLSRPPLSEALAIAEIYEIAAATGSDPLDIRLKYLTDARGKELLERLAGLSKWRERTKPDRTADIVTGRGLAYVKYELVRTYVGVVAEVEVDRKTGALAVKRFFVAHDCGQIINPDGLRNQIEGCMVQTISRTLKEQVTFDRSIPRRLSDWMSPLSSTVEKPPSSR